MQVKRDTADREQVWWTKLSQAREQMEIRKFYKIVKRLRTGAQKSFPGMVVGPEGEVKTTQKDILQEIVRFYTAISTNEDKDARAFKKQQGITEAEVKKRDFKEEQKLNKNKITNTKEKYANNLCWDKPATKEVRKAIQKAACGKATGEDKLPAEALKHMGGDMLELTTHLIGMMWDLSMTPSRLSVAITTLLHKKGPTDLIKNYRPITLLNALFKIWERVLEQRLRRVIKDVAPSAPQMGSQPKNSSSLAIMTKRSLLRGAKRTHTQVHSLQVDLNKAYNRVKRTILWNKLANMGVGGKLWLAIQSTYKGAEDIIRVGDKTSAKFTLPNGLRQGSILSPILYSYCTPTSWWRSSKPHERASRQGKQAQQTR